ncbi:MAG: BON domain-containing protein [Clostridiaceae bacterium]|nr:BON domain-containing protein [Clostridiaceae bacterium]
MKSNDDNIAEKVISGIRDELNIAANEVNVSVLDGRVELSGYVDVLAEKEDVGRIASETKGVKKVMNDITIAMDKKLTDKQIKHSLNEILGQTEINGRPVGVNANAYHGDAILVGNVDNQAERKVALREASKVFGVKNIINHIEVGPKNNRVDIENNIYEKISASTVNTANVATTVHNGKVFLDGFVKNKKEVEALMNIAEATEGVHKVVNHLEERPKANF